MAGTDADHRAPGIPRLAGGRASVPPGPPRGDQEDGGGREETVYGVTSLSASRAAAAPVLQAGRWHWRIENRSHWVRDVTFGEDASQVRTGSIPQLMAALRNTVIGLLRLTGAPNLAAARRYYAANPGAALALVGVQSEN